MLSAESKGILFYSILIPVIVIGIAIAIIAATVGRISHSISIIYISLGRWWLVGSAWAGKDINSASLASSSSSLSNIKYDDKILALAKAQRMNTDIRRSIFCVIMASEVRKTISISISISLLYMGFSCFLSFSLCLLISLVGIKYIYNYLM